MNTRLRTIGTPEELRRTLFTRSLAITTAAPLDKPDEVFGGLPAVKGWQASDPAAGNARLATCSTVSILLAKAAATSAVLAARIDTSLFLPLLVPVLLPATMSAFSVVGEREQGTLEPVLTTPVTRMELILGKAAAIFLPAVGLSYLVFGMFIAIVALFAKPAVATEMWNAPQLPAEVVFIPLLAAWAIWVGLAVSSRVSDTRVAQQLSVLASLPAIALVALMSFRILSPSLWLALALALALLAVDCGACFVVAGLFDRERLVTGTRPTRPPVAGGTVRRLPPVTRLGGTS
jgi:ABC-2 type transport system permease protein